MLRPLLYRYQLARAKRSGMYALLIDAAKRHELPPAYVLAVASRETGIRNMLGDGGHGVGVIQIDIRFHSIARRARETGSWRTNPAPLVDYGVQMLAENVAWARQRWPKYTEHATSALKIASSAYNAGRGGAAQGVAEGDSDLRTTGRNYGRDVLARMDVFGKLLQG